MIRSVTRAAALAVALLSCGCTVGPDFAAPAADTPSTWRDVSARGAPAAASPSRVTTEADPDPAWWLAFKDPILASLMARATRGNLDVQIAVVRIAQARAQEISAASAGLPNLSAKGGYTRQQLGLKGLVAEHDDGLSSLGGSNNSSQISNALGMLSHPVDIFQGALDASWELDLFGKVRRSVESAEAATAVAIGNRDDALVTLQAEVAQTYAQLRWAQATRQTVADDIAAERDILALTRNRAQNGLVSTLNTTTAAAAVSNTEAQLPQYDQQISASLSGLAVLLGEKPGALDAELAAPAPVPPAPPAVPIGLPSELARRRPDIRAAEAMLHEQTAEVGVATAQFYPDVSLTGEIGQRAERAKDLTHWANNFYSYGPSVSLPIFEGGKLTANLKLAKAQQAEAALTYRKTVLSALQDVENALAAFRTEQQHHQSLEQTVSTQATALDLARKSYTSGLSSFIDVLTAENNLVQAHEQLLQSTYTVTTDLVTLYKALGGGWQVQQPNVTSSSRPSRPG
jgi:NodT family efflux transporter outer membrane factor (OMF) lipoprotein